MNCRITTLLFFILFVVPCVLKILLGLSELGSGIVEKGTKCSKIRSKSQGR
jgi:hypothetical protein